MQALCAFAHAAEVSMRENQRIRRRIVHGGDTCTMQCPEGRPLIYISCPMTL